MEISAESLALQAAPDIEVVEKDQIGFAGLTADTFMQLLITELQNQDPLSPIESQDMLNQLSMMRNLQANIELGDAIKAITSNQQLSTASSFIGKQVVGFDEDDNQISGVVERAFLRDSKAYVGVDGVEVPLSSVNEVQSA